MKEKVELKRHVEHDEAHQYLQKESTKRIGEKERGRQYLTK